MLFAVLVLFNPELAFAQFAGGGLESKVSGITSGLLNFVLPAASIIGLVYCGILAAIGDASAKGRMIFIAVASVIAFLAPLIVGWLKSLAM